MVSSLAAISLINSALPDQGFLEFFGVLAQDFDVPLTKAEAAVFCSFLSTS